MALHSAIRAGNIKYRLGLTVISHFGALMYIVTVFSYPRSRQREGARVNGIVHIESDTTIGELARNLHLSAKPNHKYAGAGMTAMVAMATKTTRTTTTGTAGATTSIHT